ncbi:uncharacterized protein LOC129001605 isoform X2 [Macrosteles quadrilineatus]|uniref:uncharacterized protein LOC129001605 isoform X2 n=1 Tax=Macrosteles quadrilineatus TaxID=74068 RepID=UPI0023E2FDA6|nr:uncharacterized protein LOC129001605 isoform X2 [Macrosteles quadrilineatus]
MGTMLVNNNYFRQRLRQMEELYPEPPALGDCDCTSYSYFVLSVLFFTFGSFITVLALSGGDYLYLHLGHMWLVGPILCCSGIMVAVKIILYLRRKSVIQMLLRQRTLLREIAQQGQHGVCTLSVMTRTPSTLTLPPSYDLLMGAAVGPSEPPPPSYEEAMFLIGDEKSRALLENRQNTTIDNQGKETV